MTISRTMHSLSKPIGRERISTSAIAYVQTRTKMRAFNTVHKQFRKSGLSQAELASRLGKGTDRINKILSAPGNWTLDTIAELLFAINGGVVSFDVAFPMDAAKRNDTRPRWLTSESTKEQSKPPETASKSMRVGVGTYETV